MIGPTASTVRARTGSRNWCHDGGIEWIARKRSGVMHYAQPTGVQE